MIVYHGSYTEITEIDLSKAKLYKDFGKGFYVTNIRKQAEIWADVKSADNDSSGFISTFNFDDDKAFFSGDYKTLRFSDYTEEWFDFVINNRAKSSTTEVSIHGYDIVEGPVADDKISTRINFFLRGRISKQDFFEELKYSKEPSHQICFCTAKSLLTIERVSLLGLSDIEMIGEFVVSYLIKDKNISIMEANDLYYESETFAKLSDESTGLHKKAEQEIYDMLKIELGKKSLL